MSRYHQAVIFAGGKSSRMGKDKALLPFASEPTLSEYQYKKLVHYFHNVSLSVKKDNFKGRFPLILDIYEDASPLVGLLSSFKTIKDSNEIFILSVDTPFVDISVIQKIMEVKDEAYDVVVAESPSGLHPLCGLYKKSIVPLLLRQYTQGNHKLKDLLDLANTKRVHFKDNAPFTNLNHPKEYEEALKLSLS